MDLLFVKSRTEIDGNFNNHNREVMEPAKIRRFLIKNPSDADADADLSPDQNLLVPAIIATAIQLSYFCVRL